VPRSAAHWRAERLVVEIDGYRGHRSRSQQARDRRRELHCRRYGHDCLRYSEAQLEHEPALVAADLLAELALRRARLSAR
jgi:very-short-patch-repair endonuclease